MQINKQKANGSAANWVIDYSDQISQKWAIEWEEMKHSKYKSTIKMDNKMWIILVAEFFSRIIFFPTPLIRFRRYVL